MNLNNLLPVFAGGGAGAVLRYVISCLVKTPDQGFPYATFWINVTGCFFIGLLYSVYNMPGNYTRLLLIVGLLGGFTTFSSFGMETIQLFRSGHYRIGFFYVILSNICGLGAVYLGIKTASI